ncbi:MAG: hypothetical protein NTW21_07520 [Verrucomicrobia bacterium]|nr:hypothetical protein [Verrucomicrobiota bacterium]
MKSRFTFAVIIMLGTNTGNIGAVTLSGASITGTGAITLAGPGGSYDFRGGTVSAMLGGSVGLDKTTGGTVTLTGVNTYTGATTVSTGTLLINAPGSLDAASAVAVNGGTLGGTGTIHGSISLASGATLAPGATNSIGTLTANGGVTLVSGSTFAAQINTDPTPTADKVAVTGTLNLGGSTLTLGNLGTAPPAGGTKFTIASYTTLTGTFAGYADGATVSDGTNHYTLDYNDAATPNTITLTAVASGTPYEIWAGANGLTVGVNDGMGDDPDGDGLTNLREFAFGTDPLANFAGPIAYEAGGNVTTPGQPVATNMGSNGVVDVRVVFGRRKDWEVAGLTYTVWFSVDMTEGSWVASSAPPTRLTGPASSGVIDAVSVAFPNYILTPKGPRKLRFAQVVVSQTP